MIHYTPEGNIIKVGLNFGFTPGGFRLVWAWYDFATHNAVTYRLRLRFNKRPNYFWVVNRFNVIEGYLNLHDFDLVSREVLNDLKAMEETQKRTNEPYAYIKPL
jgi:hypothetical protein